MCCEGNRGADRVDVRFAGREYSLSTGNDAGSEEAREMMNDPPRSDEGFRPTPKMIIGAVLGVLALVFIFQNSQKGTVQFLWMDFTTAYWIWLLLMFLIGGLVGYMVAMRRVKRGAA